MENPANAIELLYERSKAYSKTIIELTKLRIVSNITSLAGSLFIVVVCVLLFTLFLLLFSIGLSLLLNHVLQSTFLGFLACSMFYLIAAALISIIWGKAMKKSVTSFLIKKIL